MKRSQKGARSDLERLRKAANEQDSALHGVKIAAALTRALKSVNISPILVGGSAVAYYTEGSYTTKDIDMIAPTTAETKHVMACLGFKKIGKDFINRELDIYVEFPSDSLGPGERAVSMKVGDIDIKIISIEDLIVDRLCAFKYWRSGIDGLNALIMLELGAADRERVEERAGDEDVLDALDYLEGVLKDSTRLKMNPSETSMMLMKYFRK